MTKQERLVAYASAALQGIIACTEEGMVYPDPKKTAERAWDYADAMLAEEKIQLPPKD